jgi:hypothetical protein
MLTAMSRIADRRPACPAQDLESTVVQLLQYWFE